MSSGLPQLGACCCGGDCDLRVATATKLLQGFTEFFLGNYYELDYRRRFLTRRYRSGGDIMFFSAPGVPVATVNYIRERVITLNRYTGWPDVLSDTGPIVAPPSPPELPPGYPLVYFFPEIEYFRVEDATNRSEVIWEYDRTVDQGWGPKRTFIQLANLDEIPLKEYEDMVSQMLLPPIFDLNLQPWNSFAEIRFDELNPPFQPIIQNTRHPSGNVNYWFPLDSGLERSHWNNGAPFPDPQKIIITRDPLLQNQRCSNVHRVFGSGNIMDLVNSYWTKYKSHCRNPPAPLCLCDSESRWQIATGYPPPTTVKCITKTAPETPLILDPPPTPKADESVREDFSWSVLREATENKVAAGDHCV